RRRPIAVAAGVILLFYLALAFVAAPFEGWFALSQRLLGTELNWTIYYLDYLVFIFLGLALLGTTLAGAWRLCRLPAPGRWRLAWWRAGRGTWFLLLWLGLEVAGYFALSPFAATRRVLGVLVVITLLAGRLASRTRRARPGSVPVWEITALSA